MQRRALLVLALFVAPVAASSVSALSAARAWLQSHKSPSDDQLSELKNANPEAFALVNSLLAKHARGEIKLSAEDRGPDVFRKMMTPRHLAAAETRVSEGSVSLPYASADVQPAIVDQASYNPSAASDKDEAMVDRLLGAVAGLAGKKGKKIALLRNRHTKGKKQEEENLLTKDSELFGEEAQPTPAPAQAIEEVARMQEQPAPAAAKSRTNSYLKGLDLSGDMPEVVGAQAKKGQKHSEGADLQSFSFDDVAPAVATPAPKKVAPPQPKKDNSFLKYLGFVKKAPAPQEQAAVAPAKPAAQKNPYLDGLLG